MDGIFQIHLLEEDYMNAQPYEGEQSSGGDSDLDSDDDSTE